MRSKNMRSKKMGSNLGLRAHVPRCHPSAVSFYEDLYESSYNQRQTMQWFNKPYPTALDEWPPCFYWLFAPQDISRAVINEEYVHGYQHRSRTLHATRRKQSLLF